MTAAVPSSAGPAPSAVGTAPTGVVLGTVADNVDPVGQGRIRVVFPWLGAQTNSAWAPISSTMAGPGYGNWFIPEIGSEAVVAFERGDMNHPIVLGFLWNGQDTPPSTSIHERMIRSVNGHTIRLLDATPTAGGNQGGIVIEDAAGNSIVMTNTQVTIHAVGSLILDGATVVIKSAGVPRIVSPTPNPI
jgi:phage baseplate assembly protein V